ncbi:MAG: translation initiation factor IF-2 [Candidatus Omnitrophica bacterium]|nr:translation initiation factor IF-2 [Candidatus Omnitrophota bacterium]
MSIKIGDLAKELNVKTDFLKETLQRLYVDVENDDTIVDEKIAALMRVKIGGVSNTQKKERKKAEKAQEDEEKIKTHKKTKKKAEADAAAVAEANALAGKSLAEAPGAPETTVVETAHDKTPEKTGSTDTQKPADSATEQGGQVKRLDKVIVVKSIRDQEKEQGTDKKKADAKPAKTDTAVPVPDPAAPIVPKFNIKAGGFRQDFDDEDRKILGGARAAKKTGKSLKKTFYRPKKSFKKFGNIGDDSRSEVVTEKITPYTGVDFKPIEIQIPTDIRSIAVKVNKRPNDLIQFLIVNNGILVNINQLLGEDIIRELLKNLGYELTVTRTIEEDLLAEHQTSEKADTDKRAPIVTFMGHVDHGKTSLMDYIRKTRVTSQEKGGITQHIGAYKVHTSKGSVAFLDTPGHEAFTAMRARGAHVTDVVVLVVAADDGVMPQTKEAIHHAQAANVPIVVAINKCDLPNANPQKVKIGLQKEGLQSEDFGGKTVMVEVSAKTGKGVDELLDILMLESELLELRANPSIRARGTVIEAKKSSDQGVIATILVQNGTLSVGDIILTGIYYGKVKSMVDDVGARIESAGPSTPVSITGLQGVPEAGDEFYVVKDEKKARTLAELKQSEDHKNKMVNVQRVSLTDFHTMVVKGNVKELKIILKTDVQGSLEALMHSLGELPTDEVKVSFAHAMVGNINESDVMLAIVANSVIIGFNVKVDPKAEALAKSEKIDIKLYGIIYEAISDVKAAMEGLLEPIEQEVFQGVAKIKQVFPSKIGKVAGTIVVKGTIHRKDNICVKRGGEVIWKGKIASLKRFKDDAREVKEGFECGILLDGFNNIVENDLIEAYVIEKIARRLEGSSDKKA